MMDDPVFQKALTFTLIYEGVYSNDVNDPGHETVFGISRKHWPNWEGWKLVDGFKSQSVDKRLLLTSDKNLRSMVDKFYWDFFWVPCACHKMPPKIAMVVFDTAVNQGTLTAIQIVQESIGVASDGVVGRRTMAAIGNLNSEHENGVLTHFLTKRIMRYKNLLAANPKLWEFEYNWFFRCVRLSREVFSQAI